MTFLGSFVALALVLFIGSLAPAHAGPLAPKKPSDIVHLNTSSDSCGNQNKGRLFRRLAVDSGSGVGISSITTLPSKQVLVVTRAEIVAQSGTPGSFAQLRFYNSGGAGGGTEYGILSTALDGAGNATVSFLFPTGVIVRSIENLCADLSFGDGTVLSGTLHGFLTKDR